LRNAVCCDGVETLGMTSLPRVIADDTASSGEDSKPPASRRASSSHLMRSRFGAAMAAILPRTKKSVMSCSPGPHARRGRNGGHAQRRAAYTPSGERRAADTPSGER